MKYLWLFLALTLGCRQASNEASRSVIDGLWESDCVTAVDQSSQVIRYSFFTNNTVQRIAQFYADPACVLPRGTLSHNGVYAIAVRTDTSAYELDLFFHEALGIPADAAGALAWNSQAFCGIGRWRAQETENVIFETDPACSVFGVSPMEYRDLIRLEPEDRLLFGAQLNHLIPRPTAVDASDPLRVFHFRQR